MKLWKLIRKPVGIVLFTGVLWIALAVVHGLPYLLTNLLLGI